MIVIYYLIPVFYLHYPYPYYYYQFYYNYYFLVLDFKFDFIFEFEFIFKLIYWLLFDIYKLEFFSLDFSFSFVDTGVYSDAENANAIDEDPIAVFFFI